MRLINFALLASEQLLVFGRRIIAIFKGINDKVGTYSIAPFIKAVEEAYEAYSAAFERESKNPYTIKVSEKDSVRDSAFLAFRNYVEACSLSNREGWYTAASKILEIIKKYGWGIQNMGYKAESAALTGIIDEIGKKCTADLQLISATEWFQYVITTQADFETTLTESVTQNTGNEPTLAETRPALIKALRSLVSFTELQYSANPASTELAGCMDAINETIVQTMTTARANDTRRTNEKKKTGAETTEPAQ